MFQLFPNENHSANTADLMESCCFTAPPYGSGRQKQEFFFALTIYFLNFRIYWSKNGPNSFLGLINPQFDINNIFLLQKLRKIWLFFNGLWPINSLTCATGAMDTIEAQSRAMRITALQCFLYRIGAKRIIKNGIAYCLCASLSYLGHNHCPSKDRLQKRKITLFYV